MSGQDAKLNELAAFALTLSKGIVRVELDDLAPAEFNRGGDDMSSDTVAKY